MSKSIFCVAALGLSVHLFIGTACATILNIGLSGEGERWQVGSGFTENSDHYSISGYLNFDLDHVITDVSPYNNKVHHTYQVVDYGFIIDITGETNSYEANNSAIEYFGNSGSLRLRSDSDDAYLDLFGSPSDISIFDDGRAHKLFGYFSDIDYDLASIISFSLPLNLDGYHYDSGLVFTNNGIAPVPEPATILLMGTGIAGFISIRKRKKNKFSME